MPTPIFDFTLSHKLSLSLFQSISNSVEQCGWRRKLWTFELCDETSEPLLQTAAAAATYQNEKQKQIRFLPFSSCNCCCYYYLWIHKHVIRCRDNCTSDNCTSDNCTSDSSTSNNCIGDNCTSDNWTSDNCTSDSSTSNNCIGDNCTGDKYSNAKYLTHVQVSLDLMLLQLVLK